MVTSGRVTLKETSSVMEISYRHAKRLKRKPIFKRSGWTGFSLLFIPIWNIKK